MKTFEDVVFEEHKDAPIVVIDSGVGGIYTTNELAKKFPVENFVLLCDNEMLPLGNKEAALINRRISKMCKKIKELKPKAIVIACNSIDSISYDTICSIFPAIPVYSVIIPTITKALKTTRSKNIALLATEVTIESQAYMKYALLKPKLNLYGVECLDLAFSIENDDNVDQVLNNETNILKEVEFDTLILGCTHYSIIKDKIAKKFTNCEIIDSVDELIDNISENFNDFKKNKANKQKIYVLITKEDITIRENIQKILKLKNDIINIKL